MYKTFLRFIVGIVLIPEALETINLQLNGRKISRKSFDATGNLSFGIAEHIEIPGIKYNPEFGIWGMDVSIALERMGYRVKKRKTRTSVVGQKQRVTNADAINFAQKELGVEIED